MEGSINSVERTIRRLFPGRWFSLYHGDVCAVVCGLEIEVIGKIRITLLWDLGVCPDGKSPRRKKPRPTEHDFKTVLVLRVFRSVFCLQCPPESCEQLLLNSHGTGSRDVNEKYVDRGPSGIVDRQHRTTVLRPNGLQRKMVWTGCPIAFPVVTSGER